MCFGFDFCILIAPKHDIFIQCELWGNQFKTIQRRQENGMSYFSDEVELQCGKRESLVELFELLAQFTDIGGVNKDVYVVNRF